MSVIEVGPDVNLKELRSQLVGRISWLLMGVGGLLATVAMPGTGFQSDRFGVFVALFGLGMCVWRLGKARPALGSHLLIWGLVAVLLAAMWLFADPWIPFVGLMLPFISTMLVSGAEFVTIGAVAALAAWWTLGGYRLYPLTALLAALAVGAVSAWLLVRTLYTALEWAWTMQQRADRLLKEARDSRGELSRALHSLDKTNWILRRTQRELILARRQAEEARLMKEQFAANVSHELRTPLNLILGFTEIMCLSPEVYGKTDWPDTLRRDIRRIHRSSRHLLEMINDILDLSRFEVVGFTLNRQATPLEPLLRETLEIVEDLFRDQPLRLEVQIEQNLPTLEIDRLRVRQVLLNLLNNAARFTEEGSVRLAARRAGGEVMISVSDTGPGIPPDELPHLFQEFYQVDRSLHRRQGGAGLGLAISKHFVEAHDGRIWVESEEGVGSTFTFTLPIPGEHVPVSHLQMERPPEMMRPEARPPILVVDPDPVVAALLRRHLEGYEVVHVREHQRLAEEVALHHPRAVVCNVPPGRAWDAHDAPLVSATVIECSLVSQAWLADDLGVAACLTKPIMPDILLREIDRLGEIQDVLVVDDDRGFCQLIERMLQASGRAFRVRRAYGGADGMMALRARRPDVLLLDLVMPGVDGFQVLEEMRREPDLADVPVVVLTATSVAEDALRQRSSRFVVHRPDGLHSAEALRCLRAVIGALEPHYDERSVPAEVLA